MRNRVSLNEQNSREITCPKCKGLALGYKQLELKKKGEEELTYHYKIRCYNCGDFHFTRTAEMYRLLKDIKWVKSRGVERQERPKGND